MSSATSRLPRQAGGLDRLGLPVWGKVVAVLAGAGLIAVSARISVPMVPVPMSLQTYAVLVIGALCGWRWGALTVVVYLAEAAVGLPVLADGASGIPRLYGTTSGYLLGFLVAVIVVGKYAQSSRGFLRWSAMMLLAHGIILALGVVRLSWVDGYDLWRAVTAGAVPFMAGAVVKSVLASLTVVALLRLPRTPGGFFVMSLPPGQRVRDDLPRFGLPRYAHRFPKEPRLLRLEIAGDAVKPATLDEAEIRSLDHVEQETDFHCVTTWTCPKVRWGGYRFVDLYNQFVIPRLRPGPAASWVVFRCQDGFRATLPLADLLHREVLLADAMAGSPLSIAHGAPLRLVAPAHYAYKNPKHLRAIEFWRDEAGYQSPGLRFMDHPRARVAFEERGRGGPGWLYRILYRPLIGPTVRRFRRALDVYVRAKGQ